MKNFFHSKDKKEIAPWINNLIEIFKKEREVELHIVAPNLFTNRDCTVNKDNIIYHFYKSIPINTDHNLFNKLYSKLCINHYTKYWWIRYKVNNIINEINPDIIHLHGAENPHYSSGILDQFKVYPVVLTIQGFIRNSVIKNNQINKKVLLEEKIIQNITNICVRTQEMKDIVLALNPKVNLYFHNYPVTVPNVTRKKSLYDIIFFAKINKDKGIEDLLLAISIIKTTYSQISLHIIGESNHNYNKYLRNEIKKLNIVDNVTFYGFMESQAEIYNHAINAKICVLPTYHDIIPGTIIESMYMKLPVVAYSVGGIPELNSKYESIVLVEKGNINELALKILDLLFDSKKQKYIAENAYNYAIERFNNKQISTDLKNIYKKIIYNGSSK